MTGITKHHSLIARPLFFFFCPINTLVDISRLLVNGREIFHRNWLQTYIHFLYILFSESLNAQFPEHQISPGFYLSGQNNLSGSHQGFTSYFGLGIKGKEMINQCIRNLVSHFIRVTFGNTFRSE